MARITRTYELLPPASVRRPLVYKEENNTGETDDEKGDERDGEVTLRQRPLSLAGHSGRWCYSRVQFWWS